MKKWNLKIYTNKSKSFKAREFILKEKKEKKILIYRTGYPKAMDVDIVEFVSSEYVICELPTKNNVTALKSLKSNKKRHYSFNIN